MTFAEMQQLDSTSAAFVRLRISSESHFARCAAHKSRVLLQELVVLSRQEQQQTHASGRLSLSAKSERGVCVWDSIDML